ncbi:MAG TPA: MFS transporter [Longimicrobiales bacterium]|nr:MFS transporter [Longimicrobiales bacterium]
MNRWAILGLLSGAELLGMSLWFTASAVSPQLGEAWGLSASEAGWLTTTVQLGFVAGTAFAAALNLADIVPDRPYFAGSALLGAAANAGILVAPGYESALVLRFLTGFFLAGVYPPAMKMIATWFRTGRGLAIGTIVGALTVGKAAPYLASAFREASIAFVVLTASAGAVAAALLVFTAYRPGPHVFERRPFSWRLVGTVLGHRPTRLAIGGYLGHMWELYAMWTLVAVYFSEFFAARGAGGESLGSLVGFAAIAMGGLGCVLAGGWADRLGRERVAIWAMAVSGSCSLVMGWLMAAPTTVVVTLSLIWGFAVVADSAQFSAAVTEVAPQHAVGTALTLQTSLGFALTALSIWVTIAVATRFGWGPAFSLLAVGPALGIPAMLRLKNVRFGAAPPFASPDPRAQVSSRGVIPAPSPPRRSP